MTERRDPIRDIAHLGHFELFTPKPEASLWYFRDLLGMDVVHEEGASVWLRGWGD
jgi:catechol 2,3-dioxygenase